ncbi:uncharacterized protein [Dermacentor andersoni]|uniref:uncharacterized protein n=1 Tax=Dermacentor andersoni TaxID=34620 RepID=UPI003B3BB571
MFLTVAGVPASQGWNDVSYHGSRQIPTPNIDALAASGLILQRHYTSPDCTPSRTALLTARYPSRTAEAQRRTSWTRGPARRVSGVSEYGSAFAALKPSADCPFSRMYFLLLFMSTDVGYEVFLPAAKDALSLRFELLPQWLKRLGYSTHMVGKWHLGYKSLEHTPTWRGFDTFFGYYNGDVRYFNHTKEYEGHCGLDFWRNVGHSTQAATDLNGTYSTNAFTDEAKRIIAEHDVQKPLFLYMSHEAGHTVCSNCTVEAPKENVDHFTYIANYNRTVLAGEFFFFLTMEDISFAAQSMRLCVHYNKGSGYRKSSRSGTRREIWTTVGRHMNHPEWGRVLLLFFFFAGAYEVMDRSVGELLAALQSRCMLADSLVVFASDNGGGPLASPAFEFANAGSNWPLRGVKQEVWEGGVRTPAVLWSGRLSGSLPRAPSQQVVHISDWAPTLYAAAGIAYTAHELVEMPSPSSSPRAAERRPLLCLPMSCVCWRRTGVILLTPNFVVSSHPADAPAAFPCSGQPLTHLSGHVPSSDRTCSLTSSRLCLQGGDPKDLGDVDGRNLWDVLSTGRGKGREEVLLQIEGKQGMAALISGRYKLISRPSGPNDPQLDVQVAPPPGQPPQDLDLDALVTSSAAWQALQNASIDAGGRSQSPPRPNWRQEATLNCSGTGASANNDSAQSNFDPYDAVFVFDIVSDPCERNNLASSNTELRHRLLDKLAAYRRAISPQSSGHETDERGYPEHHRCLWSPWIRVKPAPYQNCSC